MALAASKEPDQLNLILVFFLLHFLVYPASNGYNSYFDKDEGSIGGLRKPPKTTKNLYTVSIVLDAIALILALYISLEFMLMVLIYGLVSKAYSHPSIRLKKMPITGWLAAGIFQGYFTFLMSYLAINSIGFEATFELNIHLPAILSTVLLLGSYPMTQIYQHEEDRERGDITISQKLGILGTFHFTAIAFLFASVGFFYYFSVSFSLEKALLFGEAMLPVLIYFAWWYLKPRKDLGAANFDSTMKLNFISSSMLNGYFLFLWLS